MKNNKFIQLTSVCKTDNSNLQKAVDLLRSYYECYSQLATFPKNEENVIFGLVVKGLPSNEKTWSVELSKLLEKTAENLSGKAGDEKSYRYNNKRSFYMTLSEPLRMGTLDRVPFERIFEEMGNVLEEEM